MQNADNEHNEWLEADGLGGFAMGTVSRIRTRRYHGWLVAAATPPTGRMVLVNGGDVWIDTPAGRFPLSAQRYAPDVVHPEGNVFLRSFTIDPWPAWTFELPDGTRAVQSLFSAHGRPVTSVTWRLAAPKPGVSLVVRPFLSGRDYHSMHHENGAFRFEPERDGRTLVWRPYDGVPAIRLLSNGGYRHEPHWYRNFLYEEERARGLDFSEDLASPGELHWDLSAGPAILLLSADVAGTPALDPEASPERLQAGLEAAERRRRVFPSPLHRAADPYLVQRGRGRTIIAGYPWFTDWGRDTFIALRGLCIAGGRLEEAREILVEWAGAVSEGMLPNRFPDAGSQPEFNSVDASLWYVIAVFEWLEAMEAGGQPVSAADRGALESAVEAILAGYASGTRYGIRADADGLLAAGVKGQQLTWMDARVGDRVITPRIGKPVEIQALWLNALGLAGRASPRWAALHEMGLGNFGKRFWNAQGGCLHDVVDVDHVRGVMDPSFRPNQILAVGGLPLSLLEGDEARSVVDQVEARLLTPMGLRSLAPDEPQYQGRYEGDGPARDSKYHQGTVWPWLMGPFVEAWVRVRGNTPEARNEARSRFLNPWLEHLNEAGLGHIPEIADGDPPHAPRGCPFQAWSVGEALRLVHTLAEGKRVNNVRKDPLKAGNPARGNGAPRGARMGVMK